MKTNDEVDHHLRPVGAASDWRRSRSESSGAVDDMETSYVPAAACLPGPHRRHYVNIFNHWFFPPFSTSCMYTLYVIHLLFAFQFRSLMIYIICILPAFCWRFPFVIFKTTHHYFYILPHFTMMFILCNINDKNRPCLFKRAS